MCQPKPKWLSKQKDLLFLWLAHLNNKSNVCKQISSPLSRLDVRFVKFLYVFFRNGKSTDFDKPRPAEALPQNNTVGTVVRSGENPTRLTSVKDQISAIRGGAVVRALASHQCGPGSIPRLGVICGLSLLVLYSAPRGFL